MEDFDLPTTLMANYVEVVDDLIKRKVKQTEAEHDKTLKESTDSFQKY